MGARFLADQLEAAGIEAHVELLGDRHANVWAILEGARHEALVLHHHIDTDPVPTPEHWRHEPHSGAIEGPWIYGRGAYDMKGIGIAQLVSFIELAQSGLPLEQSVLFLATGSEEVGSDFGMKWILSQHPELADRFWGMLTEGGALENRSLTDLKYWGIEFAQKRWIDVTVCSATRGPLEVLQKDLRQHDMGYPSELRLTPEAEVFLKNYAPTRDKAALREVLADPERLVRDPALLELEKVPHYLRALLHDEARPSNVIHEREGGFELPIRFYLLPGSDFEEARQQLLPEWQTYGLEWVIHDENGYNGSSSLEHPLYQEAVKALRVEYPDAPIGPYFLPWVGTDSRFVRAEDRVSYGLSPFLVPFTETLQIGQPNERLNLLGFLNGVNVYRRVVFEIGAGAEPSNLWIPPVREEEI